MLGKDVSDVRLVETQAPRSETTGTEGFGSVLDGLQLLGGALKEDREKEAAAANGKLINEFLGQRVEASLETEGFSDLTPDAKDQVIRGVGEFDRHLTQVVKNGDGNKFTKAEILRTRKAMTAIAENPANAEAVIKAAGLSDKVGGTLGKLLQDEEETARDLIAESAQFRREQARDNGITVPPEIMLDDRKLLEFSEEDPSFAVLKATDQLEARAKLNAAKQDASELERVAAMTSEIPKLSQGIMQLALSAGQGGKSAAQTVLAIEQKYNTDVVNMEAQYPYASLEERKHIRSQLNAAKETAIAYTKGEIKGDIMDLYMRDLNIMGKKESLHAARRNNYINDKYQESTAATELQLGQQKLTQGSLKTIEAWEDFRTTPYVASMIKDNPLLGDSIRQSVQYSAAGNIDRANALILENGTPDQKAGIALIDMKMLVNDAEGAVNLSGERIENLGDNLARGVARLRSQNPQEHRQFMNTFLEEIAADPNMENFVEANQGLFEPVLIDAAGEVRQKMQGSMLDMNKKSLSLFNGSATFNTEGSLNVIDAAKKALGFGLTKGLEKINELGGIDNNLNPSGNINLDGSENITDIGPSSDFAKAKLQKSMQVLIDRPTEAAFFNNIGAFMVVDEDALNKGQVRYKLSEAAEANIRNPSFKAGLMNDLNQINASHGQKMSDDLRIYMKMGAFNTPQEAMRSILFEGAPQDMTNLLDADTAILPRTN